MVSHSTTVSSWCVHYSRSSMLERVVIKGRQSPMCQYSSDNGHATDYHLVHLGVCLFTYRMSLTHWSGRASPSVVQVQLLSKRPLSSRRAVSHRKTQVFGPTPRSRHCNASSHLLTPTVQRSASNLLMPGARHRRTRRGCTHLLTGSSRRILGLLAPTTVDGPTMVRDNDTREQGCRLV